MNAPFRPALRYLGGKWRLAPWIASHFPPHRVYVEPFCGAASVLLRKPRSQGECINDLSSDVVGLFRVLRDRDQAEALIRAVEATPYARQEYDAAFAPTDDPVEAARRLVVRSYMGHGSSAALSVKSTGFRASLVNRKGALPANDWATLPAALAAIWERLQGVVIEHRDARAVIDRYAGADTLLYVDPPYLPATRSQKRRGGGVVPRLRPRTDGRRPYRPVAGAAARARDGGAERLSVTDLRRPAVGLDPGRKGHARRPGPAAHRGAVAEPRRRGGEG